MINVPRSDPGPELADAKAADVQLSRAIADELRRLTAASRAGSPLSLSAVGAAVRRLPLLSYRADLDTLVADAETGTTDSPDLVVVDLTDGSEHHDRASLLRSARDLLPTGGRLVISAYVVSPPGGAVVNPPLSSLVEEVLVCFGGMVHFDEVRSLRLAGERHSRVVLLSVTSLWPGSR